MPECQFYKKNGRSKAGVGYKCYEDNCLARLHLKDTVCTIANSIQHEHLTKEQMMVDVTVLNKIKEKLQSIDNRLSPLEVFNTVVAR